MGDDAIDERRDVAKRCKISNEGGDPGGEWPVKSVFASHISM